MRIAGSEYYSKLDLTHAYQQLELEDESAEMLTLSTHKALFKPTRLMYGVASASGIFLREIELLLGSIDNVVCYQDDILIGGKDFNHHKKILYEVLNELSECGLPVSPKKCKFFEK